MLGGRSSSASDDDDDLGGVVGGGGASGGGRGRGLADGAPPAPLRPSGGDMCACSAGIPGISASIPGIPGMSCCGLGLVLPAETA